MSWRSASDLDSLRSRGVERYNARHSPPGRRMALRPNSVSLHQVGRDPAQARGFTASPSLSKLPPAHYQPVVAHMPRPASLIPPVASRRPPSAAREMMSSSTVTLHRGGASGSASGLGSRRPPSAEAAAAWQRRRPSSGAHRSVTSTGAGRMARVVSEPIVRDSPPPRATPELSQSLSMLPIGMHSQSSPRLARPASTRGDDSSTNPASFYSSPSDQALRPRNESLFALREAVGGTGGGEEEKEKAELSAVADLVPPQPPVDPTETEAELARRYPPETPGIARRGGVVLPGDGQSVRQDRRTPRRISGSGSPEAKPRAGMRLDPTATPGDSLGSSSEAAHAPQHLEGHDNAAAVREPYYCPLVREPLLASLRGVPYFAHLKPAQLEALLEATELVEHPRYSIVVREGVPSEASRSFFVVLSGTARVLHGEIDGLAQAQLEPGDYFGEAALVSSFPRMATVVAVTDARVLRLRCSCGVNGLLAQPWFARAVEPRVGIVRIRNWPVLLVAGASDPAERPWFWRGLPGRTTKVASCHPSARFDPFDLF